jgi:transcriptional regulator with XRE-family HTH domain
MTAMTPARFIREQVFGVETQREWAKMLGYRQPTISRYETGQPLSSKAQDRIRRLARKRRIEWDNNWFFEIPEEVA